MSICFHKVPACDRQMETVLRLPKSHFSKPVCNKYKDKQTKTPLYLWHGVGCFLFFTEVIQQTYKFHVHMVVICCM